MNQKQTTRKRKSKLYRDINDFRKDYELRTNAVHDERGDLFADPKVSRMCG